MEPTTWKSRSQQCILICPHLVPRNNFIVIAVAYLPHSEQINGNLFALEYNQYQILSDFDGCGNGERTDGVE